jgi:predicted nucleic acid-binding protein
VNLCFLDASAWLKRYTGEPGWEVVEELFAEAGAGRLSMISTAIGHAEVVAALTRFRNRTALENDAFDASLRRMAEDEVGLLWLAVTEKAFWASTPLIVEHSLNATDAALLVALLDLNARLHGAALSLQVVTSDRRLARAATAFGLLCIDPEASSAREIRALADSAA